MRTPNGLGWGTSKVVTRSFATDTRQQRKHKAFRAQFSILKNQYGHGAYSWAEGVTRKSARKIARNAVRIAARKAEASHA